MKKRGFEVSFSMIFTVFVGAVIIFLAVFAAMRLANLGTLTTGSARARSLSILMNPVETNIEEGKFTIITVPDETRLYNYCDESGTFGEQGIGSTVKQLNGEWPEKPEGYSGSKNKYLFTTRMTQADDSYFVFTMPFSYPFKVADLIYLWSDKQSYCFVQIPAEYDSVREIFEDLKPEHIFFDGIGDLPDCPAASKTVCFERSLAECDINVQRVIGGSPVVQKRFGGNYEDMPFDGDALLLAAVFSDPDIYNCQVKRLTGRASQLALVYRAKSEFQSGWSPPEGCYSGILQTPLEDYSNKALTVATSTNPDINDLKDKMEEVRNKNGGFGQGLACKLF